MQCYSTSLKMANYDNKFEYVQEKKTYFNKFRQIRISKRKLENQPFHSTFVGNDSPTWITNEFDNLLLLYLITKFHLP
jgi:hypothetical protein